MSAFSVEEILRLYQQRYEDFNVRHFHEKLREQHHIRLSYTWVKQALQTAGLVKKSRKRGVRIASGKVATQDVLWACSPGGGTRGTANHRCASAKKAMSIYAHCWCRGRTTFWDALEKIAICGADGRVATEAA